MMRTYRHVVFAVLAASSAWQMGRAGADELSLVKGVYQGSTSKQGLSSSEFGLGARYAKPFSAAMHWYADASLGMTNYAVDEGYEPKSGLNIKLGGGVRHYFDRFSERLTPYGTLGGYFENKKNAASSGSTVSLTETEGLYYHAHVGLRLALNARFFMEVDAPLFTSALTETVEVTTGSASGDGKTTKTSKSTRNELFVDSTSPLSRMNIAVGMRF